jgi:hypothetical protein
MVKVSIEVQNGAAHFEVAVRAQSIERAVCVVRGSYPSCAVSAKFPIDPDSFFVKQAAPGLGGIVGVESQALIAA